MNRDLGSVLKVATLNIELVLFVKVLELINKEEVYWQEMNHSDSLQVTQVEKSSNMFITLSSQFSGTGTLTMECARFLQQLHIIIRDLYIKTSNW